jgi:hydroxyacylglutathione hydrolase
MIEIKKFTFNPFQENTYLLYDSTGECVIVDPGCYDQAEQKQLAAFISQHKLKVIALLNTHCHIDHVLGNKFVKDTYNVKLLLHKEDEQQLRAVKVYAPNYGFHNYAEAEADGYLTEGEEFKFGNSVLEVLFVPGHAPGHIAFYNAAQKICIAGDVLFRESIGRTDLPGGNHATLISSIREKLFPLSDDVVVYPGHGPSTTIGHEKKFNPFM